MLLLRIRKSSPSSPRPPRALGISRYGRSGGESTDFHSGPITAKAATVTRARSRLHRANHCEVCDRRLIRGKCPTTIEPRMLNVRRRGHCFRCDSRLVGGKCPSCGYDLRDDGDFDDEDDRGFD